MTQDRLQIAVDDSGEATEARLTGELDLTTADKLASSLGGPLDSGKRVTVDLADLAFVDSTGLGALVDLHHRGEAGGGGLVIRGVPDQVNRLLEITKLNSLLQIQD